MTGEPPLRTVPAALGRRAASAPITMPSLPDSLRPLVEREIYDYDADQPADDAWRMPSRVPDEVRPVLPTLIAGREAAMRAPTEREVVAVLLGRLAMHYALADRPAEHHQMVVDDYVEDLAEYPAAVIAEVVREWRRTEKWWPRVAELRERCETILHQRRKELVRLRFLQWCCQRFDGQVPRLMRRYNGNCLEEAREGPGTWMLEDAMRGRCDFAGLTFVLPKSAADAQAAH